METQFAVVIFLGLLFIRHSSASIPAHKPIQVTQDKIIFVCTSSKATQSSPSSNISSISTAPGANFSKDPTANYYDKPSPCIFDTEYTHTFTVSAGHKFIRLHFYSALFRVPNISNALFSVSANGYTLLTTTKSSFSNIASHAEDFIKEFCVHVVGQILNVTFTPSHSSGSFAIVNMIEIVSVQPNLYIQEDNPIPVIHHTNSEIYLTNSTALEMMYRLNVGGDNVSEGNDCGMFRVWLQDRIYLNTDRTETVMLPPDVGISYSKVPWYTAPREVYATARTYFDSRNGEMASWSFPLDYGFSYLVRLHFCEVSEHITRRNQRVFRVYIDNQTAETHADIIRWSNGSRIPVYRDYIVNFTSGQGIMELLIAIQTSKESTEKQYGAILNGLEIFKLSDLNNSLAGPDPFRPKKSSPSNPPDSPPIGNIPRNHSKFKRIFTTSLLIAILALPFLCAFFAHLPSWLVLCSKNKTPKKHFMQQWESSERCRYFPISEMKTATNNFSDSLLIGFGGFGKVYKGFIHNKATIVAIKRGSPTSNQGLHEFQTEITMLSKLRHCHLVSLIGCCMDNGEMILVYEFMVRGNLRDHLCNPENPPLPWEKRLKICIGAARGLHYLHTGMEHTIIHRDVKTRNILLDQDWVAKVSDFGLSRLGPNVMSPSQTHVSTLVKGSFGYLDPEYFRLQRLTEKSDVYSFGVVLFEVLCARPAVIHEVVNEQVENYEQLNLAEWVLYCDRIGTLDQIIDPYLRGKIKPECLKTFTDIAKKCLANRGSERPTMGDVQCNLELAWRQQIGVMSEEEKSLGVISRNRPSCELSASNLTDGNQSVVICHQRAEVSDIFSPMTGR